ncbi:MAG: hypothetical protein ABSF38_09635 [Verrucomicrobiota bacterium]|jgi:hypothetical protein
MRNGKIAKLPPDTRDELNLRMEDGQDGAKLLQWLNSLPEVQQSLKDSFDGLPVNRQNLCEWRKGGYREWQIRRDLESHACRLKQTTRDMEDVLNIPTLPADLIAALALRYAAVLNTWDGEPDPRLTEKLRLLHSLGRDIALIQKTTERATKQAADYNQMLEDSTESGVRAARKKALISVWAALRSKELAKSFGGGKHAQWLADYMTALEFGLPFPNSAPEKPSRRLAGLSPDLSDEASPPAEAPPTEEVSTKEEVPAKAEVPTTAEVSPAEEASPAAEASTRQEVPTKERLPFVAFPSSIAIAKPEAKEEAKPEAKERLRSVVLTKERQTQSNQKMSFDRKKNES